VIDNNNNNNNNNNKKGFGAALICSSQRQNMLSLVNTQILTDSMTHFQNDFFCLFKLLLQQMLTLCECRFGGVKAPIRLVHNGVEFQQYHW
jgi:hypothetical protein